MTDISLPCDTPKMNLTVVVLNIATRQLNTDYSVFTYSFNFFSLTVKVRIAPLYHEDLSHLASETFFDLV